MERHLVWVQTDKKSMPTEEAVDQLIQSCIEEGYFGFICSIETQADLMVIQHLKKYQEKVALILLESENSLSISRDEKEQIYDRCFMRCKLDDFIKDREEREQIVKSYAGKILEL